MHTMHYSCGENMPIAVHEVTGKLLFLLKIFFYMLALELFKCFST